MPKEVTEKQLRFLLSKGSTLTEKEKERLKRELKSGTVKIKKG